MSVSVVIFQATPRLRWTGKLSTARSRVSMPLARSSLGKASITFVLLETILWSLMLAHANRFWAFFKTSTVSTSDGKDFNASSTY